MNIIINGKPQHLTSAKEFIRYRQCITVRQPKHVITELNGTIVPSDQWAQTSP